MKARLSIVLLVLAVGCARGPYPERAPFVGSLFAGAEQSPHFGRLNEAFPTHPVYSPKAKFTFTRGDEIALPPYYVFKGETRDTTLLLTETDTVGLLVIKDDEIRFQHYYLGVSEETRWLSRITQCIRGDARTRTGHFQSLQQYGYPGVGNVARECDREDDCQLYAGQVVATAGDGI